MQIREITTFLEEIAPLHFQESYDNAGLIVGNSETDVTDVLISLDVTEAVIDEAIALGCNMVVAHHPIVFKGLKRFNGTSYVERVILKAIRNDIAIYAIHTNLDNVFQNGVNEKICQKVGVGDLEILAPKEEKSWKNKPVGSGMIGNLEKAISPSGFLDHLKSSMHLKVVKHTPLLGNDISRIAVCGGSGGFLLKDAIRAKADVFITADYKYHEFFDANNQITIIDIGHYESEIFTVELLYQLLSEKFSNFAAHCTKVNTNPVNYY